MNKIPIKYVLSDSTNNQWSIINSTNIRDSQCFLSNRTLITRLSECPSASKTVNQSTLSSPSFQAVASDTSQPRRLLEMQHVRCKLHGDFAKWKQRAGPIVANERLPTRMGI